MFDEALKRMNELIKQGRALISYHAYNELEEDDLSVSDVESCLETGSIVDREWDSEFQEWKYRIYGDALAGDEMAVIAKLDESKDLAVIITVFRITAKDYGF